MQLLQWWVTHTIDLMCLYLSPHYRHRTHFQHSLSVECSTYELPTCDSGITGDAYDHVTEVGGMMPDSNKPYEPKTGGRTSKPQRYHVIVTDWYRVPREQAMIDFLLGRGTLTAMIDSTKMGLYKSGIFSDCASSLRLVTLRISLAWMSSRASGSFATPGAPIGARTATWKSHWYVFISDTLHCLMWLVLRLNRRLICVSATTLHNWVWLRT